MQALCGRLEVRPIDLLDEDSSLALFRNKGHVQPSMMSPRMLRLEARIVRACCTTTTGGALRGLPLALKVAGGVLLNNADGSHWEVRCKPSTQQASVVNDTWGQAACVDLTPR